jgi:hypothetical protein
MFASAAWRPACSCETRRADIETFARELEARGRARATVTVTRRLCTIAGFYNLTLIKLVRTRLAT